MASYAEHTNPLKVEAAQTSAPFQGAAQRAMRLFFIDHLRVALTMLVIVHHLSITYGAQCPCWYYQEPTKDGFTSLSLSALLLVNQSFFMGLFFLLAGYFTPGSYERKGAATFLKDRLLRLGVPLLIFFVVLNPLVAYLGAGAPLPYWQFLLQYGPKLIGPGPLWFVEALLVFDCLYALWRRFSEKRGASRLDMSKPLTLRLVVSFMLLLVVATFLVRLVFPFGWTVPGVNIIPSNFPQYIGLFIAGTLAARSKWLLTIPGRLGKLGLGAALVATCLLFPLAVLSGNGAFSGGVHWQAFVYALWESIMAVGLGLGLLVVFRRYFNRQGRLGKFLSAQAYTVYIVHALVIVILALLLRDLHLYPLLKFVLVVLIGVPLCFGCAYLVRKLPFAQKIL